MDFIIKPHIGVNELTFTMKRYEIHNIYKKYSAFFKSLDSGNLSEHYENQGFFAYYNESDCLDAIEIYQGRVFLDTIDIFSMTILDLFSLIKSKTSQDTIINFDSGYDFLSYGFSIYNEFFSKDNTVKPSTVLVFSDSYGQKRKELFQIMNGEF